MPLPSPPGLGELMAQTPFAGRAPGLFLGVLLLGWGERLYRLFVLLPGMGLGAWLAASLRPALGLDLQATLVLGAVLAAVGALACHFLERWAVRLTGAMVGAGATVWAWPLISAERLPWWGPVAAGLVAALVFPRLWQWLLRPVTALFGAQLVAWAVGAPQDALLVLGLAFAGTVAQALLAGKKE